MKPRSVTLLVWLATILIGSGTLSGQDSPGRVPEPTDEAPDPDAMIEQAIKLIEAGDLQEANKLASRVAALRPTMDRLKLAKGLMLVALGKGPEAIRSLEDYNQTEEGRKDYRACAAIGRIYLQTERYRMARRNLEQAIPLAVEWKDGKPVRAGLLMDLAIAERRLAAPKEAAARALEAAKAAPDDPEIQYRFAEILALSGSADDYEAAVTAAVRAIHLLDDVLRNDPFNKEKLVLSQSAHALRVAIQKQERQRNPQNPSIAIRIAESLLEKTEADKRLGLYAAREFALQAIELDEEPEPVWQVLVARISVEAGGVGALEDARDRLAKVLQAHPDNEEARKLAAKVDAQLASR